jgi:hypothetical protein
MPEPQHIKCNACGSSFPPGYWHECPGSVREVEQQRTAGSIAEWLESLIPTARRVMPERANWYRDLADEIRRGEWRKERTP